MPAHRRRTTRSVALVFAAVLAVTLLSTMGAQGQEPTLAERGVGFGAYAPPSPWAGMDAVHQLEAELDARLDVVHSYHAWGNDWGRLDPAALEAMSADGRVPLLTWEPWKAQEHGSTSPDGAVTDQPEYRLTRIADGAFDDYVREWARKLREFGDTVYLRPMHEMNGDWYPWSGVVNGNTPEDYVAAWQHLHDVFREEGADNVHWVWSPLVDDVPSENNFEQYWPGSRHVDVLAVDGYNWGAEVPGHGGWRSFNEVFGDAYGRLTALGPEPVWLAEVGSDAAGGDKAAWVRDMFASTGYERLEAIVWFNDDKERDWRLTSPPEAADAAAAALARRPADRGQWVFGGQASGDQAPDADGDAPDADDQISDGNDNTPDADAEQPDASIVQACPPERVPEAGFADTRGNAHSAAIDCVLWYEVARGVTAERYAPAQTVTRDQMASFLARAMEQATDLPPASAQGFDDVEGNTHAERIRQLAKIGVVRGTTGQTYSPRLSVSRGQMATFLVRAVEYLGGELPRTDDHFRDDDGNPHEASINKAASGGFVSGTSPSTVAPAAPVRRDQMASFVARTLNRLVANGQVSTPAG